MALVKFDCVSSGTDEIALGVPISLWSEELDYERLELYQDIAGAAVLSAGLEGLGILQILCEREDLHILT